MPIYFTSKRAKSLVKKCQELLKKLKAAVALPAHFHQKVKSTNGVQTKENKIAHSSSLTALALNSDELLTTTANVNEDIFSNRSHFFDCNKVWYGISESTGKFEYFRDNGEKILDFSYDKYGAVTGISDKKRFPSFESFQRYRVDLISLLQNLFDRIMKGNDWEQIDPNVSGVITFELQYPDGKNGDINMFLAETCGTLEKINATTYKVVIPVKAKEVLVLFRNNYHAYPRDGARDELDEFLKKNNLYHKLRALHNDGDIHRACLTNEREILQTALQIADVYIKIIRSRRNNIYSQLLEAGKVSPKWKSEFTLYEIIKSNYPDAKYQYRADWLGAQSLDIYIPSISVAVEYQGIQHYKSIPFFGGEEGLKKRVELDKRKQTLCAENNVIFVEFRYDEALDSDYIQRKIKSIMAQYFTEA